MPPAPLPGCRLNTGPATTHPLSGLAAVPPASNFSGTEVARTRASQRRGGFGNARSQDPVSAMRTAEKEEDKRPFRSLARVVVPWISSLRPPAAVA
jgi:hypothetical protein